jgi:hypothetical protein
MTITLDVRDDGCRTETFRNERPATTKRTNAKEVSMVRLHKWFCVFEVDRRRPRRKGA